MGKIKTCSTFLRYFFTSFSHDPTCIDSIASFYCSWFCSTCSCSSCSFSCFCISSHPPLILSTWFHPFNSFLALETITSFPLILLFFSFCFVHFSSFCSYSSCFSCSSSFLSSISSSSIILFRCHRAQLLLFLVLLSSAKSSNRTVPAVDHSFAVPATPRQQRRPSNPMTA